LRNRLLASFPVIKKPFALYPHRQLLLNVFANSRQSQNIWRARERERHESPSKSYWRGMCAHASISAARWRKVKNGRRTPTAARVPLLATAESPAPPPRNVGAQPTRRYARAWTTRACFLSIHHCSSLKVKLAASAISRARERAYGVLRAGTFFPCCISLVF